jgi:hypothetical protein
MAQTCEGSGYRTSHHKVGRSTRLEKSWMTLARELSCGTKQLLEESIRRRDLLVQEPGKFKLPYAMQEAKWMTTYVGSLIAIEKQMADVLRTRCLSGNMK